MAKQENLQHKTADELADSLLELKKESFNLRFQRSTGALEKTHRFRQVRRMIARIRTELTRRKTA